jgi:hypothetical protein
MALLVSGLLTLCGCEDSVGFAVDGQAPVGSDPDASSQGTDGAVSGDGSPGAVDGCTPPDMLLLLDRTMSMSKTPAGPSPENTAEGRRASKWHLAIAAFEALTSQLDGTIRFGLELFPKDPGKDQCVTLAQRIDGQTATNAKCQGGEVLVGPALETGDAIASALDPETTLLCTSTPIGAGLATARAALSDIASQARRQYAVVLTDGRDTCDESLSLANAQKLVSGGVELYVIGFDGSGKGVDNGHLNDLACAGHTAKGFPFACVEDAAGNFTAKDREGAALYILAQHQTQLIDELKSVAGQVCCNCVI